MASGNCDEPVAGMGGLGQGTAVTRAGWQLENP